MPPCAVNLERQSRAIAANSGGLPSSSPTLPPPPPFPLAAIPSSSQWSPLGGKEADFTLPSSDSRIHFMFVR